MIKQTMAAACAFMLACTGLAGAAEPSAPDAAQDPSPKVMLKTSKGEITLELDRTKAPLTVANFLKYVESKHYDGTIFHRVIPKFMIQGGGFTADLQQKPAQAPIKNEATNGLKNVVGSIAMARTGVVDSATAQFFINVRDNVALDHRDTTAGGFGYAVFGKVVDGMDVVTAIEGVATAPKPPHRNVPTTPVVIESAVIVK